MEPSKTRKTIMVISGTLGFITAILAILSWVDAAVDERIKYNIYAPKMDQMCTKYVNATGCRERCSCEWCDNQCVLFSGNRCDAQPNLTCAAEYAAAEYDVKVSMVVFIISSFVTLFMCTVYCATIYPVRP